MARPAECFPVVDLDTATKQLSGCDHSDHRHLHITFSTNYTTWKEALQRQKTRVQDSE
jgi:hypothetical protein